MKTILRSLLLTLTLAICAAATVPTGTVKLYDGDPNNGGSIICYCDLDANGNYSYSTTTLSAGSHSLEAVYLGDNNYLSSNSTVLVEVITPAAGPQQSATSIASAPNPAVQGTNVTVSGGVVAAPSNPAAKSK